MRKILAVDDDKDILEVLQFILEDSGFEVDVLADGTDMLDKIKQSKPDLILLDIMLGGLDGRDLCRDIKNNPDTRNIPVILLSATHDINYLKHQIGCPDAFVAKPFDIEQLLDAIHVRLEAASSHFLLVTLL